MLRRSGGVDLGAGGCCCSSFGSFVIVVVGESRVVSGDGDVGDSLIVVSPCFEFGGFGSSVRI